jgi:ligand-binding sensor domain-containing protein
MKHIILGFLLLIIQFSKAQNRAIESIDFGDVSIIEISPNGNVWVGSVSSGCSAFIASNSTWDKFDINNSSMKSDSITAIELYPISGVAHSFMGTPKGIGYKHGAQWDTIADLINPIVVDITRDKTAHLLYVATKSGISVYNDTTLVHLSNFSTANATLPNDNVSCFQSKALAQSGFYFGTIDSGYYSTTNGVVFNHFTVASKGLISNEVNCLFVDEQQSKTYVGTKGGFSVCESNCLGYSIAEGLVGNDVTAIDKDCNGKIWIGTKNNGISIFDTLTQTFSSFQVADGLPSNKITAINCQASCDCYIGTADAGALIADPNKVIKQLPSRVETVDLKVAVFPNPTTGVLNFQFKENFVGQLIISNMLGQKMVSDFVDNKQEYVLDSSSLEKGVYLYTLTDFNHSTASGKVLIVD